MWYLVVSLGLTLLSAPAVDAQGIDRLYRVGFVGPYGPGMDWSILLGYQQRLQELGWVDGQSIETTYRWADGVFPRFPNLVDALLRTPLDLLVLPCGPALKLARERSPDIPIVARCLDVKDFGGEIGGLGQAGRRTTGVTYFSPSSTARRLELLKEAVPGLTHIGLLYRRGSDWIPHLPAVEAAARTIGLRVHRAEWVTDQGLATALDEAIFHGARAALTLGDGATHLYRHRLFEMAAERKLPVMYDFPMFPAADELGLMAYYADVAQLFRRVAEQVDAILKGQSPASMPLLEPQKFRFMVNLRAARALGLTLPEPLVQRADSVLK